ncbi:MAG: TetR/AcrR family transcriptional regulator, partial [Actinomycetia bacterium]|nr:TetR/AcrR family transcriptional regulator [Actinomycetes bacterium]
TLYNSFGGKQGLYELATTAYLERAETSLFEPLANGTDDGYADILEFLSRLRSGLTSPEAIPGCLIVNDMAARSPPDAAERYRARLEAGFADALRRTGHSVPEARSAMLTAAVIGVNLVSKMTGDPNEIGRMIDAITDTVTAWQGAGT